MGLDGVEILMEVEETFGIQIADEEAAAIRTVGDLCDAVVRRLEARRAEHGGRFCPSASAFRALRRGIMEETGLPRRDLRPSVATALLIGSRRRRARWRRLETHSQLRLPRLTRPDGLVALLAALSIVASFWAGWWLLKNGASAGAALMSVLVLMALFATVLVRVTRPLAACVPRGARTIGELARVVGRLNYGTLMDQTGREPTAEEVQEAIRDILVKQLGVPRERVTRDAEIVKDLGAG